MKLAFWKGSAPVVSRRPLSHTSIVAEMVGRPHSGKSALMDQLIAQVLQSPLQSGLSFRIRSPRKLSALLYQAHQQTISIGKTGRRTTTDPQEITWQLCDRARECVSLRLGDNIGQVLTRTFLRGQEDLRQLENDFRRRLSQADVIWQVLPVLPARPTTEDVHRIKDDIQLTCGYIHDALARRDNGRPCVLAVVASRLDTRYDTVADARMRFRDELGGFLQRSLRPLLDRPEITEAALFPLTALGFGVTTVSEVPREDSHPFLTLSFGEKEWLLKKGLSPRPYNILPVVVWSLLAGLRQQEVADGPRAEEHLRLAETLSGDLKALRGWYFTLKDA